MDSSLIKFDATYLNEFVRYALENHLGVIPDPVEPWFSRKAIAWIMGYEDKSFSTWQYDFPEIAHPLGKFYRLSQYLPKISDKAANEKRKGD